MGNSMLLIFTLGLTGEDQVMAESKPYPEMLIPKHGPSEHIIDILKDDSKAPANAVTNSLRQHYCFAVETKDEVDCWEKHLRDKGVEITGKM